MVNLKTFFFNFIAKNVGLIILREQLKEVVVPDQTGEVSTPIGKVTYEISQIKIYDM